MKLILLILGFLSALLIICQLVMGLLILQGQASMRTAHQHSGYLTVVVSMVYIAWSLATIASMPRIGSSEGELKSEIRNRNPKSTTVVQSILTIGVTLPSGVKRPIRKRAWVR